MESEPPLTEDRNDHERERRRLERLLPEIIKRLLETGYEKLSGGPENVRHFVSELKLPKEALALILAQIDETKNGLYRVVAKEIRDFLEHTNFSDEMAKVLTTVSFEIRTEVRFIPNDSRLGASPDVKARVRVKRDDDRPSRPPAENASSRRSQPPDRRGSEPPDRRSQPPRANTRASRPPPDPDQPPAPEDDDVE